MYQMRLLTSYRQQFSAPYSQPYGHWMMMRPVTWASFVEDSLERLSSQQRVLEQFRVIGHVNICTGFGCSLFCATRTAGSMSRQVQTTVLLLSMLMRPSQRQ